MAIRFYDEALIKKISSWDVNNKLMIIKPDEVSRFFQINADINNDKPLKLPLIAISRDTDIMVLNNNKKAMTFDGAEVRVLDDSNKNVELNKTFVLNAIPIQISYQLDIYTRELAEADEYLRNFVFNFINYPNLTIEIPYNNVKLMHESTIYLDKTIQDNSDIPQRLFPDQFTRYTIKLIVDNAYLFSAPSKDILSIDSNVSVDNKNQ